MACLNADIETQIAIYVCKYMCASNKELLLTENADGGFVTRF